MIIESKHFEEVDEQMLAPFSIQRHQIKLATGQVDYVQIEPDSLYDGTSVTFVCNTEDSAKALYDAMLACNDVSMMTTR